MIGFFPDPYPDELLYSVFARFQERLQYPSKESVVSELFGTTKAFATIDLPSHLNHIIAALPPGHRYTVDRLIDNNTLLPFYSPFLPYKRSNSIRENMGDGKKLGFHYRAGISSCRISLPNSLRFCPLCTQSDLKQFGEHYWHRLHQVPGVEVCPVHVVFLEKSSALTRNRANNQEFTSAGSVIPTMSPRKLDLSDPSHITLKQIADDVTWLLNQQGIASELQSLRNCYIYLLAKLGLVNDNGTVRLLQFLNEFKNHYSCELLRLLQCEVNENNRNNWLLRLIHFDSRSQHPLHHLLLIHFLRHTAEEFFQITSGLKSFGSNPQSAQTKKPQSSYSRIAKTITPETKEMYRRKWLSILVENPDDGRSLLRQKFSGVYSWLYYNDNIWLKEHLPERQSGKNSSQFRVDWFSRDSELSNAVLLSATRLKNPSRRPVRVTIHSISKDIDQSSLLKKHLHKLPLTALVLADVVETHEEFAIRRIWWASECYRTEQIHPQKWQLIRRAHIKSDMAVVPHVKKAIDAALQSFEPLGATSSAETSLPD